MNKLMILLQKKFSKNKKKECKKMEANIELKEVLTSEERIDNPGLYYEATIRKSSEILDAYNYAVQNNFKYYRCIGGKGNIYAWRGNNYKNISQEGFRWEANDKYVEPVLAINEVEEEIMEQPIIEPVIEPIEEEVQETIPNVEEDTTENEELDTNYKELYREAIEVIDKKEQEYEELYAKYQELLRTTEVVKKFFKD